MRVNEVHIRSKLLGALKKVTDNLVTHGRVVAAFGERFKKRKRFGRALASFVSGVGSGQSFITFATREI